MSESMVARKEEAEVRSVWSSGRYRLRDVGDGDCLDGVNVRRCCCCIVWPDAGGANASTMLLDRQATAAHSDGIEDRFMVLRAGICQFFW